MLTTAKAKFRALAEQSQSIFNSEGIKQEDMKTYLANLCSTKTSPNKEMIDSLFKYCNSTDTIFAAIEQYGLWSYMNYFLLEDIVAEFLENLPQYTPIKAEIEAYAVMLQETILSIYLEQACQQMKLPLLKNDERLEQYFTKWTLILRVQQNKHRLKDVDDFRRTLAIEFEVPRTMILLFNFELASDSLTTTWMVPKSFQEQLITKLQSCLQRFNDLLIMKIGECNYYEVLTLTLSICKGRVCISCITARRDIAGLLP